MNGFTVDQTELGDAAAALWQASAELRDSPALKYAADPAQSGYQSLSRALADFQESSLRASKLLADTTEGTAEHLRHTVRSYRDTEERVVGLLDTERGATG